MYGNSKQFRPVFRALCILSAFYTMPSAADLASDKLNQQFSNQASARANNAYDANLIDDNGREQKAASAQDKSGSGEGMAAATGAALIATGTGMLPSIIPSVSAAGATLIAQGVQELAQAAADSSTKDQNGAQKDLLLQNTDGTAPSTTPSGVQLPANLQSILQQNGVNPDAYTQQAVSGALQSPNAALSALGLPPVSADDSTAAQNLANQNLTSTLATTGTTSPLSTTVTMDESAKANGPTVDGSGGGGGGGGGSSDGTLSENTHGASGGGAASTVATGATGTGADGGERGLASQEGAPASSRGGLSGLLAGLGIGGEDAVVAGGEKPQTTRSLLMSIGVLPPQPKQNIFQLAHRNFRSFQKWRQPHRLAQK